MYDLGVSVSPPNSTGKWTDADLAAIFGRKVVDGMIAGRSLEHAEYYGRLAGSYGLRALAHREAVEAGYSVIRSAFGGR